MTTFWPYPFYRFWGQKGTPPGTPKYDPSATVAGTGGDVWVNNAHLSTTVAVRDGNWSDAATWSMNAVPGPTDIVGVGYTVTLDTTATVLGVSVYLGGVLQHATSVNTSLSTRDLVIHPTGTYIAGTASTPISSSVTAQLIFRDVAFGDSSHIGNGCINVGTCTLWGSSKTEGLSLAAAATAGQTSLTLASSPSNWAIGDKLLLLDSHQQSDKSDLTPQTEILTITSVSGATIGVSPAIAYDHKPFKNKYGSIQFYPDVCNLTRNMIVKSENPAGTRGWWLNSPLFDFESWYVAWNDLGRTTLSSGVTTNDGFWGFTMYDCCGPSSIPASGYQWRVRGNVFSNPADAVAQSAQKWPVAITNSYYGQFRKNIIYNGAGALLALYTPDVSWCTFDGNYFSTVNGTGDRKNDGTDGDCFWARCANNYVKNNVSSGAHTPQYTYGFAITMQEPAQDYVVVAAFQGANPSDGGGSSQTLNFHNTPVLQFENNTAYSCWSLYTVWGLHVPSRPWGVYQTPRPSAPGVIGSGGTFLNNKGANWAYNAFFVYPMYNVVHDGWQFYADWSVGNPSNGFYHNDYPQCDCVYQNCIVDGPTFCWNSPLPPNDPTNVPSSFWINNCTFRGVYGVYRQFQFDIQPWGGSPRTIYIDSTNTTWDCSTNIYSDPYGGQNNASLLQLDQVIVTNWQSSVGNNFRVYYASQNPGTTLVASDPTNHILGATSSGHTNLYWSTTNLPFAWASIGLGLKALSGAATPPRQSAVPIPMNPSYSSNTTQGSSAPLSLSVLPGSALIACITSEGVSGDQTITAVQDSLGNNFTQLSTIVPSGTYLTRSSVWAYLNHPGGSDIKVTATTSGDAYIAVGVTEMPNLVTSSVVDGAASSYGVQDVTQPSTGSFSTSHADDVILITLSGTLFIGIPPMPAGFTPLYTAYSSASGGQAGSRNLQVGYKVVSSTQSNINPTWTSFYTNVGMVFGGEMIPAMSGTLAGVTDFIKTF